MYSSHLAGSFSEQSASLPGSVSPSSGPLRMTRSRALRAASRARAVVRHFSTIFLASAAVLLQPLVQALDHDRLDDRAHLGVAQLGLGLALELRVGQLDRDDGGQTLTDVVAGQVLLALP